MLLYACSTNPGKLFEFRLAAELSKIPALILEPLPGIQHFSAPDENGATFEENASIKALYYSRFTPELVFADDSGLEVNALAGAPGVRSARYAGPQATDRANNDRLLRELQDQADRKARFVCVIALARHGRVLELFRDTVEGEVLTTPSGTRGFGYDPLFYYPPFGRSFAELTPDEKLAVSHRGKALKLLFRLLSQSALAG